MADKFLPIGYDGSAGKAWLNTARTGTFGKANTAMYYGSSFDQAGFMAVFKNDKSYRVTIHTVESMLGTYQTPKKVYAEVICKKLGTNYKTSSSSIVTKKSNVTKTKVILNSNITTVSTKSIKLNSPIVVEPGEYFCVGIISDDLPSGYYFNMGLRRLSKIVNMVFYTQDRDTSKDVTWYKSGNANDTTNWKLQQPYIFAYGDKVVPKPVTPSTPAPKEEDFTSTPSIKTEPPKPVIKLPEEKSISLNTYVSNYKIEQGSKDTSTISVIVGMNTINTENGIGNLKNPTWSYKIISNNASYFTVVQNDTDLTVAHRGIVGNKNYYTATEQILTIEISAVSNNNTGRIVKRAINIIATPLEITEFTVSKSILRPTERAMLYATCTGNDGGLSYTIETNPYLSLNGNTIIANNRTDNYDAQDIKVTVCTNNCPDVKRTLSIKPEHWTTSDVGVSLSSSVIYADSAFGDSSSKILATNVSSSNLALNYKLNSNTVLSFSNKVSTDDTKQSVAHNTKTLLYCTGSVERNTADTLTASLSCDTAIMKAYTISILKQAEINIVYPKTLKDKTTVNLPAIAVPTSKTKYKYYISTFPIFINVENVNKQAVTIALKDKTNNSNIFIGGAYEKSILAGTCIIRSISGRVLENQSWPTNGIKTINYELKVSTGTTEITKSFTVNYNLYKYCEYQDDPGLISERSLISKAFQNRKMYASDANITIAAVNLILKEYTDFTIPTVSTGSYIVDCKENISMALAQLNNLIEKINNFSASLVKIVKHRELISEYFIMADDSCETLMDGRLASIPNSTDSTASPFRELAKALYNITTPAERLPIIYSAGSKEYEMFKYNNTGNFALYF